MTIKNTGKNISAEQTSVLTDVFEENGIIRFSSQCLYDESASGEFIDIDLSKHRTKLIETTRAAFEEMVSSANKDSFYTAQRLAQNQAGIYLVPSGNNNEGIYEEYYWSEIANSNNYQNTDYIDEDDKHYNFISLQTMNINLEPIKSAINAKLNASDVIDNLTTNSSSQALSAAQGKALNENKVNISQGSANANKNVVTNSSGNISLEAKINVVNNLTSTSTTDALSAAQGKSLNDNKVNISQGSANANKNVVTGSDGKITTEAKYQHPSTHPATMITGLASVATTGTYSSLSGTPALKTVATTGNYNDLINKPTIPDVSGKANSADLATVATSGDYNDLINKPTSSDITGNLATVATSGSYNDLTNKPTIPTVANNLTTTQTGQALDASQGKVLADMIGDAISYINQ